MDGLVRSKLRENRLEIVIESRPKPGSAPSSNTILVTAVYTCGLASDVSTHDRADPDAGKVGNAGTGMVTLPRSGIAGSRDVILPQPRIKNRGHQGRIRLAINWSSPRS